MTTVSIDPIKRASQRLSLQYASPMTPHRHLLEREHPFMATDIQHSNATLPIGEENMGSQYWLCNTDRDYQAFCRSHHRDPPPRLVAAQ